MLNPVDFALKRPITILVAMVALIAGGWLAWQRIRVDIFPALNLPVVYVPTLWRHGSPADGRSDRKLLRVSLPLH